MRKDVFAALTEAGIKTDSHESDLYALDSPETRKIVYSCGYAVIPFKGTDGATWLDLPFAYTPFWTGKVGRP